MVNFLTRPDKVQELIELISNDEEALDVVRTIHFQETFPFTYDVRKSADVSSDFPDPAHNVDDFKAEAIVAVEFQILSRNFKAPKKVDAVKAYSFLLLGVYLVDDPMYSMMSTPNKCQCGEDECMVTPPRTRRTITSKNLLETWQHGRSTKDYKSRSKKKGRRWEREQGGEINMKTWFPYLPQVSLLIVA